MPIRALPRVMASPFPLVPSPRIPLPDAFAGCGVLALVLTLVTALVPAPAPAELLFDGRTSCQVVRECDDGIDNDLDGAVDFLAGGGGDPECVSSQDASESAPGEQVAWLVCESLAAIVHPSQYVAMLEAAPYLELIDIPGLVDLGEFGGVPGVSWEAEGIETREYLRSLNVAGVPDDDPDVPNLVIEQIGQEAFAGPAELGRLRIDLPLSPVLRYVGAAYDVETDAFVTNTNELVLSPMGSTVLDDFESGFVDVALTPPAPGQLSQVDDTAGTMVGGFRRTHFIAINGTETPLTGRLRVQPGGPLEVDNDPELADRLEIFYGLDASGDADPLDLDLTPYNALRLDFGHLDSGVNLTLQLRSGSGGIRQLSFNLFGPRGPFTQTFPLADFGLDPVELADVDLIGLILQTAGPDFGSQYALDELAACLPTDRSCGRRVPIDFDFDPEGTPLAPGTPLERVYEPLGVRFEHAGGPGALCGLEIHTNGDQPSGFGSTPNVVSPCRDGVASDFSEDFFGRVVARFATDAFDACIETLPVHSSHRAVLRAFDAGGGLLDEAISTTGAAERLCVHGDHIRSVEFSGLAGDFARFDDLEARFVPEPGLAVGLGAAFGGLLVAAGQRRRGMGSRPDRAERDVHRAR